MRAIIHLSNISRVRDSSDTTNPKDRTKKKTEYLLEFENEAMCMFQAILGVSEYLYRLRELELMEVPFYVIKALQSNFLTDEKSFMR